MKRIFTACVVWIAAAQSPAAFEVASVKPTGPPNGPLRVYGRVDPDGINYLNMTLRDCIEDAFSLKRYQLAAPDWVDGERFVIVAKAAGPAQRRNLMEMFQTLLANRFKLTFHRETRDVPVYALVVAKNGPKLKEAADDSVSEANAGTGDDVAFHGTTMARLAATLSNSLGRPVLDETGLAGKYDFQLAWSERKRKGASAESASPEAPSIFTALSERLGLKLESRKEPMEMLVIDHVERPTEN